MDHDQDRELKQQQDFTNTQRQLALKLAGSDDLDTLLSASLEACLKTSDMDSGGIYLLNQAQNQLVLRYHKGLGQEFIDAARVYKTGSDRWKLVMQGTPLYMEYEKLPVIKDQTVIAENIKSIAVIPLLYMGRVIGSVNLASHQYNQVSPAQRLKLEKIIIQAVPAINRVQQRQRRELESTQFRQIFDDLQEFFVLVRFDGKILFANQYLLSSLQHHGETLIDQPVFKILNTDSAQKIKQVLLSYAHTSHQIAGIVLLSQDGEQIFVNAQASMTSQNGEPVFAFWFKTAEKKELQPVLEDADNVLNSYDDLPVPVLFVDPNSMLILYANQFVSDQYGYSKSEMMQKNFLQFFDSEAYHKIAAYLREYRLEEISRIAWYQIDAFGQKMRVRFFIRIIFRGKRTIYVIVPNPIIALEEESRGVYQDRYRSVLDQQTDIVMRFSPDGLITYVNQAYCDFFNKTAEQVIGTPFMETVYANDFDIVSFHLAQLTPERPLRESKNRMWDGEKNIRWLRWIDRAIFEGGQLVEVQGVGRDITEAEEAALKNVNLENQFRSLIDHSPAIIYFLEAKTLFPIYVNAQLEKITGYSKQEFLSDSGFWKTIIYPEDFQAWVNVMEKRQVDTKTLAVDFRVFTKTGQLIWLKDEGGLIEITGQGFFIEGMITDITHQKKSEEKLAFYLELERLINRIVKKLVNTQLADLPETIQDTLTMIGQFMEVDRSYIFYYDKKNNTISNEYEWCAEDINPQREQLQNIQVSELPYLYERIFVEKQALQLEDVKLLGIEAEKEKEHFIQQDILSILVVPMLIHNKVIGFMGFDSVRKKYHWTEDTTALLQVVSNLIVLIKSQNH